MRDPNLGKICFERSKPPKMMRCPVCFGTGWERCPGEIQGRQHLVCNNGRVIGLSDKPHNLCDGISRIPCRICSVPQSKMFLGLVQPGHEPIEGFCQPYDVIFRKIEDLGFPVAYAFFTKDSPNGSIETITVGPLPNPLRIPGSMQWTKPTNRFHFVATKTKKNQNKK